VVEWVFIRRATEATTGRDVAMKVMLRPRSESQLRRFLNEARITARLAHP
jgi:serine/threonine protein kinase